MGVVDREEKREKTVRSGTQISRSWVGRVVCPRQETRVSHDFALFDYSASAVTKRNALIKLALYPAAVENFLRPHLLFSSLSPHLCSINFRQNGL